MIGTPTTAKFSMSRAQMRKEAKSSGVSLKPGSTRSRYSRMFDDVKSWVPVISGRSASIRSSKLA